MSGQVVVSEIQKSSPSPHMTPKQMAHLPGPTAPGPRELQQKRTKCMLLEPQPGFHIGISSAAIAPFEVDAYKLQMVVLLDVSNL